MDKTLHKEKTKFRLDNVLVVNFFNAINESTPQLIGNDATEDDLNSLLIDYHYEFKDDNEDYVVLLVERMENEIFLVLSIIEIIELFYFDKEIKEKYIKKLKDLGYNFNENDLTDIETKIKSIKDKINTIKQNHALNDEKKNSGTKNTKINTYKILAQLSLGVGFEIDYDKLTIIKYIYYIKSLKDKNDEQQ